MPADGERMRCTPRALFGLGGGWKKDMLMVIDRADYHSKGLLARLIIEGRRYSLLQSNDLCGPETAC